MDTDQWLAHYYAMQDQRDLWMHRACVSAIFGVINGILAMRNEWKFQKLKDQLDK